MSKRGRSNSHYQRTVNIDLNNVRIGGGAYAVLQQSRTVRVFGQEPVRPRMVRPEKVENLKRAIESSNDTWVQLNAHYDAYDLTQDEYFEIAKYAIDLNPRKLHYIHDDKLSANQYYEVCYIMAKHGMFDNHVNIDKLVHANNNKNPLFQIMFTALVESVFSPEWYNDKTVDEIVNAMNRITNKPNYLNSIEIATMHFAKWILAKCFMVDENRLKNIPDNSIKYVMDIVIQKIQNAQKSDFLRRLNFTTHLLDEKNILPKNVHDAGRQIVDAIIAYQEKKRNEFIKNSNEQGYC